MPLSSWGDDESNRPVLRRKIRPSKEPAVEVVEEVSLVDDDEVDDDADDVDVGADGVKGVRISDGRINKNVHDWLELEETFWKLP